MDSSSTDEENGRAERRDIPRLDNSYLQPAIFYERYRFSMSQVEDILRVIGPEITRARTARHDAISPKQKLLSALRFYASGSFYYSNGDAQGMSKAVICNAVKEVTAAINRTLFDNVKWPNDIDECRKIAKDFQDIAGIRNVCGALDGTLVKIKTPSLHEPAYADRKHNHSLNVMAVCGPNLYFYFVSARWPGSVNDCRVLRNSALQRKFQQGNLPFADAVLLGDSIYPTKSWLIPMKPSCAPNEAAFYQAHAKTRQVVERAFGLLKGRFRALKELRVSTPEYSADIIKTCEHSLISKNSP